VTDRIGSIVLRHPLTRQWWFGFAIAFAMLMMFLFAVTWLLYRGIGIWG